MFAPLSFGAVETWAFRLVKALILLSLAAWLLKSASQRDFRLVLPPFLFTFSLFLVLVLLQLTPLPSSWISLLSRFPAGHRDNFHLLHDHWNSLTINPTATVTAFSNLLTYFAFCLLLLNNFLTREKVMSVLNTLIALGAFEALYGLIEYWSGHQHIFWHKKVFYTQEVTGTYINHNHFAGLMELMIPLAIGMLILGFSRNSESGENNLLPGTETKPWRVHWKLTSLLLTVGLMFLALLLSKSRAGLMCTVASLLFLAYCLRKKKVNYARILLIAFLATSLIVVLTITFDRDVFDRFSWVDDEARIRLDLWQDCGKIVRDFPLWGSGLGTFAEVIPHYRPQKDYIKVSGIPQLASWSHAHNDYLQLLIECGGAGFLALIWGSIRTGRQLLSGLAHTEDFEAATVGYSLLSGMIALLLHSFVDFNFHIPANALLFCVCLSLCLIFSQGKGVSPSFVLATTP